MEKGIIKSKPLKLLEKGCCHVSLRLISVALLSSLLFGYNVAAFNTTRSYAILDFGWCDGQEKSVTCTKGSYYSNLIGSSIFLSALLGCLLAKSVVETGRRLSLRLNFLIYVMGGILSALSEGFKTLMLGRLLMGVGVGFSTVCPPRYIGEMTPKERRGFYGSLHQMFIVFGLLIAGLMGLALGEEPMDTPEDVISDFQRVWWRLVMAMPALISVVGIILLSFVYSYETPLFYYKEGMKFESYRLLSCIVSNGEYAPHALPMPDDQSSCAAAFRDMQKSCNTDGSDQQLTLLEVIRKKKYLHILMIGIILAVGQQFSGINALMANSNAFYRSINLSRSALTAVSVCMYILNVIMTFPALWLIEAMGRKTLLILGNALQGVFLLAGGCALLIAPESKISIYMGITATFGYVVAFAAAYGPVLWVYLFECFPGNMHYVGPAVSSAASWASAFIVVMATDSLLHLGSAYVFLIFGIVSIIIVAFVAVFVRETRNLPLGHSPYIRVDSITSTKEP